VVYLDNAATTWPKPQSVLDAVYECMKAYGANPGRSGHRMAVFAASIILYTREMLCSLFNVKDPFWFIFTFNCTDSLNMAIKGLLKPGQHVITTSMEHNSIIRPLMRMENQGVEVTIVKCSENGQVDPDDIKKAIKANTSMIITTHASNVTGTLMPVEEIGDIARSCGIIYLIDAAQTAGIIPIDLSKLPVDLVALPGHKGLLGPQGTGVLYIREGVELETIREGGTGSQSDSIYQPDFIPDKYESGTMNTPGIAGLGAGIKYLQQQDQHKLHLREKRLVKLFVEALSQIKGIRYYGLADHSCKTGIVSINIGDKDSSEVTDILDQKYGIAVRGGLHCSPMAHQTIGTEKKGVVRFSFGIFNTMEEVKYCVKAVEEILRM